jgi:hypothetical protein
VADSLAVAAAATVAVSDSGTKRRMRMDSSVYHDMRNVLLR